ncbi:MAG TPA: trypsin-like peptidase domain-containing protein [Pyrinomonadaceae bacterium]|jgi:putative serine protease PepD|nr:trypsin-like peptidase domain-containing protein [Pyrinomonadaceae bacterium]
MYKLSVRQILAIALLSAAFAAGTVACYDRFGSRFQPAGSAAFTGDAPSGITDPSVATEERNNIEVYRSISPGVVFITSTSFSRDFFDYGERQGTGSGSIIDEEGHVLTNYHVIEGAQRLSVNFGGDKNYPAKEIGRDPDTDLAVIKVEAPRELLRVVPLGDSDKLIVGQKVLAIGNPFGLDRTLTTGVISGLQRPIQARNGRQIEGAIQTDASINPGNSGGPLLDSQGRMIGINSQILSPAGGSVGVGFAVPVNIAKRIVPELIRSGQVVRPKLGVNTFNVSEVRAQADLPTNEGVGILQVVPNSSAAAAGLRGLQQSPDGGMILGDIITAIDGERVKDRNDLYRILDKHQVGDTIRLEILRDGKRTQMPVKLLPPRPNSNRRF